MKRDRSEDAFSPLTINSEAAESFIDDANTNHAAVSHSIAEDCLEVGEGDLSSVEQRLIAQATTLDVIFTRLVTKAASAMDFDGMEAAERTLKMALKAQQQSASTMKVLAEMKQPKHITIARQANVANQQYIDNSNTLPAPHAPAHGKKNLPQQNQANELQQIEGIENATLDTRITQMPLTIDAKTDTRHSPMGTFNGAKDAGG